MPFMISSDMTEEEQSATLRARRTTKQLTLESSRDAFLTVACLSIKGHASKTDSLGAETQGLQDTVVESDESESDRGDHQGCTHSVPLVTPPSI